jgi:4-hydroxybenzoate polyprenyltransferase
MKLTIQKSTLLHLRIPFSLYLMPVFCFAAAQVPLSDFASLIIIFIAIHFFLYPASNGFNSYYDKDEESIGGLENPPPVSRELLYTSLAFDAFAIILALFFIDWQFALMLFIYGLVSKAYSHDKIRLKKYPVISLITAAVFQGAFTYLMTVQALQNLSFSALLETQNMFPAIVSSIMILGFYPMTQVYQHNEDAKRGDMTFSRLIGVKPTFIFAAMTFAIASSGFYIYFTLYYSWYWFLIFLLFLFPVFIYFVIWFLKVLKDESAADFRSTMFLNRISAYCLIAFFLVFALFT